MAIVQAGSGFPYLADTVYEYIRAANITSVSSMKDYEIPNMELKQLVQKVIVPTIWVITIAI